MYGYIEGCGGVQVVGGAGQHIMPMIRFMTPAKVYAEPLVGDRVGVEWEGVLYHATVTACDRTATTMTYYTVRYEHDGAIGTHLTTKDYGLRLLPGVATGGTRNNPFLDQHMTGSVRLLLRLQDAPGVPLVLCRCVWSCISATLASVCATHKDESDTTHLAVIQRLSWVSHACACAFKQSQSPAPHSSLYFIICTHSEQPDSFACSSVCWTKPRSYALVSLPSFRQ